ncbi:MAG: hypothetical protein CMD38_07565 [Flavobacteriales bacterium]|nr:hypothetical protein [Flavobacteriales bacterium]
MIDLLKKVFHISTRIKSFGWGEVLVPLPNSDLIKANTKIKVKGNNHETNKTKQNKKRRTKKSMGKEGSTRLRTRRA